jgi:hypothetical protein
MTEPDEAPAPNPVAARDLAALVGVLATLEGELIAQEVSPYLAGRLARRMVRAGLLASEQGGIENLPRALHDLNHRLRFALGEYSELPE